VVSGGRWALVPGRHRLRAEAGVLADEVEIEVEGAEGS
jgi:hypothetical protein